MPLNTEREQIQVIPMQKKNDFTVEVHKTPSDRVATQNSSSSHWRISQLTPAHKSCLKENFRWSCSRKASKHWYTIFAKNYCFNVPKQNKEWYDVKLRRFGSANIFKFCRRLCPELKWLKGNYNLNCSPYRISFNSSWGYNTDLYASKGNELKFYHWLDPCEARLPP